MVEVTSTKGLQVRERCPSLGQTKFTGRCSQPLLPVWPRHQSPIQKPLAPLRMKPEKEICPTECDATLRRVQLGLTKLLPLSLRDRSARQALASQSSQNSILAL